MKLQDLITLTEASNLECPNCGEDLGKDTQLGKKAFCGNCGTSVNNPRGSDDDDGDNYSDEPYE